MSSCHNAGSAILKSGTLTPVSPILTLEAFSPPSSNLRVLDRKHLDTEALLNAGNLEMELEKSRSVLIMWLGQ